MADRSSIEWTDATWNPIGGCTRVSEGCKNCYAEVMAARFSDPGQWGHGLAKRVKLPDGTTDHRWTGKVQLNEKVLPKPLSWKKPRRIFVNSTSDLFHESVPDEWIDKVFAVMTRARQHTFQILTKRPERAKAYLNNFDSDAWKAFWRTRLVYAQGIPVFGIPAGEPQWPLPNVWMGTSVEDQATADERIPHLLDTPAAVRFLSCEPLLGPVDLNHIKFFDRPTEGGGHEVGWDSALNGKRFDLWAGGDVDGFPRIGWVIVGGESGHGARPMHPDWARSLRDQCQAAGVPFFFKQWGEWAPFDFDGDVRRGQEIRTNIGMIRTRKKAAGRKLDGREWNEVPLVK